MTHMYQLPKQRRSADGVLADVKELKAAMTPLDRGRLSSTAFQGKSSTQKPRCF